ncbi:hypothetical protein QPM05_05390 [Caldibacillus thermoamylovorans]|nr:hypothetical protein [Caldibacillus thermoamylovorans]
MDGYILFGSFGQLGFEICEQLLNKGYQVNHVNVCDDYEDQEIIEEKNLMLGRNANFKRMGENLERSINVPMIIPLYDWLFYDENQWEMILKKLEQIFARLHVKNASAPIILLKASGPDQRIQSMNHYFRVIEQKFCKTLSIYVPIIYGKWFTETSYLYHMLMGEKISRNADAIYISDAGRTIVDLILHEEKGEFYIRNQNKHRWHECLYMLTGIKSQTDFPEDETVNDPGKVIFVNETNDGERFFDEIKKLQTIFDL